MALITPIELLEQYIKGIDEIDLKSYKSEVVKEEIAAHRLEFVMACNAIKLLMEDIKFVGGKYNENMLKLSTTQARKERKKRMSEKVIPRYVEPEVNNTLGVKPSRKSKYTAQKY